MTTEPNTPTYDGLPEFCYATNPSDGQPIRIYKGQSGYYPPAFDGVWVDEINGALGVTYEQEQAMLFGSMFGWDTELSNPEHWEKDEKFQALLLSQGKNNAAKMRALQEKAGE